MADAAAALRALAIKAQVFKRLQKELAFYEKEREGEQRRVDQMRASGADSHDLRQAVSAYYCLLMLSRKASGAPFVFGFWGQTHTQGSGAPPAAAARATHLAHLAI